MQEIGENPEDLQHEESKVVGAVDGRIEEVEKEEVGGDGKMKAGGNENYQEDDTVCGVHSLDTQAKRRMYGHQLREGVVFIGWKIKSEVSGVLYQLKKRVELEYS